MVSFGAFAVETMEINSKNFFSVVSIVSTAKASFVISERFPVKTFEHGMVGKVPCTKFYINCYDVLY